MTHRGWILAAGVGGAVAGSSIALLPRQKPTAESAVMAQVALATGDAPQRLRRAPRSPVHNGIRASREAQNTEDLPGEESEPAAERESTVQVDMARVHESFLTKHADEPRNSRWARLVEPTIAETIRGGSPGASWEIGRVDCRTSTCTVEITWPSYANAVETYADLLHSKYGVPCASSITLRPANEPDGQYQELLALDCSPI